MEEKRKKYELLQNDFIAFCGGKAYRVRYLVDIPGVCKAGQLGGYIQSEDNLSHNGTCAVLDKANVIEDAMIIDDAIIRDRALVCNAAIICRKGSVYSHAKIKNECVVEGNVGGFVMMYDNTHVHEGVRLEGNATIRGEITIEMQK